MAPAQAVSDMQREPDAPRRLALFDLDHTLLDGDSDVLWCEFLMDQGILDRAEFEPRNRAMAERYARGEASAAEFCGFYVGTLAGVRRDSWLSLQQRFFERDIAPRLSASAVDLVERHRAQGDRLVLTTATNRFLTEMTARALRIDALIATEVEIVEGVFTGRILGTPNMREGKVIRLREWLSGQGLSDALLAGAVFYSDSANDLPLLRAVGTPVAVNSDETLEAEARINGWKVLRLVR
ncbi:MAG: HAD family hydrolase [Caldimonas sp.]